MKERVQGCVTVGVAMVGAGALALAPLAPQPAVQVRADQIRTVDGVAVDLLAETLAMETLPTNFQERLAELATGAADSGGRLAVDTALGALTPLAVNAALASPDPEGALKAIVRNFVDAPLEIVDPIIFAVDNVLPAPYGGDTDPTPFDSQGSDVLKFRVQVLYALREAIRDALGVQPSTSGFAAAAMAPDPVGDPVFTATRLAQGLGESGKRLVTDTALGALGPLAAAQALAKGDKQGLYDVVESYVDAPLQIADPTIFAIDDVLPKPVGGDPEKDPTKMHGSLVSNIRADVLIPARDAIKPGLKNVLGVPKPTTNSTTVEKPAAQLAADSGPAATSSKGPKHRKPTSNPISSALNKIAKDVKKATTPKTEKPKADQAQ